MVGSRVKSKAVALLKVQLVTPLAPGATDNQDEKSPEVMEKVVGWAAAELVEVLEVEVVEADLVEVLMVVGVTEEDEEVLVEATELVEVEETDDEVLETEGVETELNEELLEEEVVEATMLEDEETFPERTPETTLLPAGEALPSALLSQQVPDP